MARPPTLLPMPSSSGSDIGSFTSDVLAIERHGPVATLWLDRPEKRNAMGPAFWSDLPRAMVPSSAPTPTCGLVVVAARGPHFTVGLDLKAMAGLSRDGLRRRSRQTGRPLSMAARAARRRELRSCASRPR